MAGRQLSTPTREDGRKLIAAGNEPARKRRLERDATSTHNFAQVSFGRDFLTAEAELSGVRPARTKRNGQFLRAEHNVTPSDPPRVVMLLEVEASRVIHVKLVVAMLYWRANRRFGDAGRRPKQRMELSDRRGCSDGGPLNDGAEICRDADDHPVCGGG
jgi:hypothetical protein